MSSTVFVVGADNSLFALRRTAYDSEDLFQRLLGDHPALLEQVAGPEGRLLLVQREAPVPEEIDGAGRWSLDHLFLDRSGVPVLVEVKRATDTRLRREVVAQMLDYAANGVAYWPIDQIVSSRRATAEAAGENPETSLAAFLADADPEAYWRQVEANLRSGRVRLVFVADSIPKELRRIVEFLNEQMRPAEVLALEVEQYATPEGMRLLTPRLIGKTERAEGAKAVEQSVAVGSIEDWFANLEKARGVETKQIARKALDWFKAEEFQTGRTRAGIWTGVTTMEGNLAYLFFFSEQTISADLYHLQAHTPFVEEAPRRAILRRLRSLPSAGTRGENPQGFPSVPWNSLAREDVWSGFITLAREIKQAIETDDADLVRSPTPASEG
jgi:hypothetical protein